MIYILTSSENAFLDFKNRVTIEHRIFIIEDTTDLTPIFLSKKAQAILVSGAKLLKRIGEDGLVPKGRAIVSMRHREHLIGGVPWFFTYDPFMAANDWNINIELDMDLRLAERRVLTGTVTPKTGTYIYVKNFKPDINYINQEWEKTHKEVTCSLDLETMGLDCYNPHKHIVSVSLTLAVGFSHVVYVLGMPDSELKDVIDDLNTILTTSKVKIIGANLKYDFGWLMVKWELSCINFTMDTTLVGSLLDENASNSLNVHAKRFTPIGGYDDCPEVGTRICTADLKWVPIETVLPGTTLLGFDENPAYKTRMKMRVAVVESSKILQKKGVEVVLSDGTVFRCSSDHGFVAHTRPKGNGPFTWIRAADLRVGVRVMNVVPVVLRNESREAGYLAGLYDGEGYVSNQKMGMVSGISQQPGVVWDKYVKYMGLFGYEGFYSNQKNSDGVHTSKHSGWSTLKLLQELRPERLINKFHFEGHCVPSSAPKVRVVSVTPIGIITVVSLQTSTRTFVAEGLASHNSFNQRYDKGHMELVPTEELINYAGGDTDAALQVSIYFKKMLQKDKALARFYVKLLHPAVRAFEKVEQEGILIDLPYFFSLQEELQDTIASLEERALTWVSQHIKNKYYGVDKDGKNELRLSKSSVIKDIMFTHPKGLKLSPLMVTPKEKEPSTAMEHLFMFQDHPQAKVFVEALKEYGSAQKTLGTYITGFLAHLRPDGRFHPNFQFFRGDSGGEHDSGTVCVTADTLFLTDRGHVSTLDVFVGQHIISHTGKVQVVTDFIYNGIQQIYKVTTEGGLSLRTNALHPYLLSDGSWVEACELKAGNMVVVYGSVEKWGEIPNWPYEVSTWGRVRNSKGKIIKPQVKGAWGHLKVALSRDSNQRTKGDMKDFGVHQLVASVWLPGGGDGQILRHINGIAFDNYYLNLAWCTQLENKQDDVLYGTASKVGGCQAKLNWKKVSYIHSSSLNDVEVAKNLGVSRELVRDVRLGKRWVKRNITEKTVKFKIDKIISVELDGIEETFGISVSEDNSHITNGIVTHNTGRASAVGPAIQCLKGSTKVLTNKGWLPIQDIVARYEQGVKFEVLTHTGKAQPIIGVYRNGVQPVLTTTFEQGILIRTVTSTGNHPFLTKRGWVRADELQIGETCYALKRNGFGTQNSELHKPNILQLGSHEKSLQQQEEQGLPSLGWKRDKVIRALEPVREFPKGYGGETKGRDVNRSERQQRGLHSKQLQMGHPYAAATEQEKQQVYNLSGENSDRSSVGKGVRDNQGETPLSVDRFGTTYGNSLDEGEVFKCGVFEECKLISIVPAGDCETYDLTVQNSHSFIAGGIVVHNTLPKHTSWAKRLRKGYIAPEDFLIVNWDYSQGELRIVADIANELTMLGLYAKGYDQHMVTGGAMLGYSISEMLEMETSNPELFKFIRQNGKAGNFGLCLPGWSLILTLDSKGVRLIPLEDVRGYQLVWDGKEWVNHGGVIYQGEKEVWTYQGQSRTPDHEVWSVECGKVPWCEVIFRNLTPVKTGDGLTPLCEPHIDCGAKHLPERPYKLQLPDLCHLYTVSPTQAFLGKQYQAGQGVCLFHYGQIQLRPKGTGFGGTVRLYGAEVLPGDSQAIQELQREGYSSPIQEQGALYTMGFRDFPSRNIQGHGVRPDKQPWALQPREFEVGNFQQESSQYGAQCSNTVPRCCYVLDGLAKSLHKAYNPKIGGTGFNWGTNNTSSYNLSNEQKQKLERLGVKIERVKVYDILNAGPRRRFTADGMLVSNCYGMGAKGFKAYAKSSYGVTLTLEEADDKRNKFFDLYTRLLDWHDEQKATARKFGYIRTPLGRVRHLPMIYSKDNEIRSKAERQAINSPVQATLSDMTIYSLSRFREAYGDPDTCRMHCFTHDALTAYVHKDTIGKWVPAVKEIMETLPLKEVFGWEPKVKFITDAEVGNTWADLEKYPLWLQHQQNKVNFVK